MRTWSRLRTLLLLSLALTVLPSGVRPPNGQIRRRTAPKTATSGTRPRPTPGENSSQRSTPPRPTAAWLLAPPNPLNVTATLSGQAGSTLIRGGTGGTVFVKGPDGTRFTLTVPKGALPSDTQITMTPVTTIQSLPFGGGLVAAVQITPEDLPLALMPTLAIDPPVDIAAAEQMSFASFGYHENGKEFHLYPLEADPSRITFRLVRFGGFGIARGTDAEREAVRQRIPTDPSDRMLMQIEKLKRLLRERRLRQTSAKFSDGFGGWTITKASWRQTGTSAGNAIEFLRSIVNSLREQYHQVVIPNLKGLKLECGADMEIRVQEAIASAYTWMHNVDVLGIRTETRVEDLTPEERDWIIKERLWAQGLTGDEWRQKYDYYQRNISITPAELEAVERERMRRAGYDEQEIPQLQSAFKAWRVEFQQLYDALDQLIVDTLNRLHDKAYECCLREAKDFYASVMDWVSHVLALRGLTNHTGFTEREECLCAINSASAGQSGTWLGEITHTENYDDEGSKTLGSQGVETWHRKMDYEATFTVMYSFRNAPNAGGLPAQVSATGKGIHDAGGWTTRGQCTWGRTMKFSYNGKLSNEETNLDVQVRPDGTYHVNYTLPCVPGSGLSIDRSFMEGGSCNPFEIKRRNWTKPQVERSHICPTETGVLLSDGRSVGIDGHVDAKNPKTLSDTATFEIPLEENPKVKRIIFIKWKLTRCR